MEEIWALRRDPEPKLAGICSALARSWQVDPLLLRVAAVLLGLSSGIGVVLYAVVWLRTPAASEAESPVQRHAPGLARQGQSVWTVATVLACLVVALSVGSLLPLGVVPGLVVLAVWYFGFLRPRRQRRGEAATQPGGTGAHPLAHDTPFTRAAATWQQTVLRHQAQLHRTGAGSGHAGPEQGVPGRTGPELRAPRQQTGGWSGAAATSAPDRTTDGDRIVGDGGRGRPGEDLSPHTAAVRAFLHDPDPAGLYRSEPEAPVTSSPRSRGGLALVVTLAGMLLAVTALALLDRSGALPAPVPLASYLGAALLVSAVGLLVAARCGRFPGQLVLAVVLALTATAAVTPVVAVSSQGWADQELRYTTLAELPPATTDVEVGSLVVDLSGLDVTRDTSYRVDVEVGSVTLVLPRDADVDLVAETEAGQISLPDAEPVQGVDLEQTYVQGGGQQPVLTVSLSVDVGSVEVRTP